MTIFSKNLGGHDPFAPPGYAYGLRRLLPLLLKSFTTFFNNLVQWD